MNRKVNLFSSSFICLFLLAQRPTWGADASDGVPNLFNDEHHLSNSLNRKLRNLNEIVQDDLSEISQAEDELEKHEEEEEDVEVEEEQHEQQHGHTVEDPREGDEGNENDPQEGTHEEDDEDFMGQWTEVMANDEGDSDEVEDDTDSEEGTGEDSDEDPTPSQAVEGSDATGLQTVQSAARSDSSNSAQTEHQRAQALAAGSLDQGSRGTGDQGAVTSQGRSEAAAPRAGDAPQRETSLEGPQGPSPDGAPESPDRSVPSSVGRPEAPPPGQGAQSDGAINGQQSGASTGGETQRTERPAVTAQPTPTVASPDSNDAKIKYLDKLYDEVLTTSDSTKGIHVPDYHSKYNTIRKKYEYSMNPVEYEIVKNLFNVGFKKDGAATSDATPLVNVFKKALADEKFQAEFDNFVHGLYGFAKRHNYLSEARMKDNKLYSDLLKNAISLMNTIEVN